MILGTITMEYLDSEELAITEYFDIRQNSWSNLGVSGALDKGSKMCEQL
jgi:hypothetical protein